MRKEAKPRSKDYRRFDSKVYVRVATYSLKRDALAHTKRIRSAGHLARLTQTGQYWVVWLRAGR